MDTGGTEGRAVNLGRTGWTNRWATYIVGTRFDLSIESVLVFVPERWVADQQNVQYDAWQAIDRSYTPSKHTPPVLTASPNVHWLPIRVLFQHFGRQISRSAGKAWWMGTTGERMEHQ